MLEIPLSNEPEQLFSIVLSEVKYDVRVTLNSRTNIWSLSLSIGDTDIILGVPLLSGVDIFKQYNLPIKNAYVVNLDETSKDPDQEDLGTSSKLFILTDEELSNV